MTRLWPISMRNFVVQRLLFCPGSYNLNDIKFTTHDGQTFSQWKEYFAFLCNSTTSLKGYGILKRKM